MWKRFSVGNQYAKAVFHLCEICEKVIEFCVNMQVHMKKNHSGDTCFKIWFVLDLNKLPRHCCLW